MLWQCSQEYPSDERRARVARSELAGGCETGVNVEALQFATEGEVTGLWIESLVRHQAAGIHLRGAVDKIELAIAADVDDVMQPTVLLVDVPGPAVAVVPIEQGTILARHDADHGVG